MGIAMMAFLHGYLKYTQPLFVQSLMGLKGVWDAKPVHIHIFGKPAEGDLKRPFKAAPGMFGGAFFVFCFFSYTPAEMLLVCSHRCWSPNI